MSKFNLEQIIANNLKEDNTIDYEKATTEVNNQLNGIIAKNKVDVDKVKNDAINEFITSKGIEGVDSIDTFDKYLEGSKKQPNELEKLQAQLTELETNIKNKETELIDTTRMSFIKDHGVTDPDEVEFLKFKFEKGVNEENTFEQVAQEYFANKPQPTVSTGVSVTSPKPNANGNKHSWEDAFDELNGIK